jgi:hypothetical protein
MLYNFFFYGDDVVSYMCREKDGVRFFVQNGGQTVWSSYAPFVRSKQTKEAMKTVAQEQHTVAQRLLDEGI